MRILILSGFLGSGKTTSVIRIGNYLKAKGYTVAVLVNDIGDVGVDGQFINENGLTSKEMPRGCICCTLRYALEGNISLVQALYDPDFLLIEPTGVAFPLRIKEQIKKMDFGPEVSMGPIITLIDGSKFGELMEHYGEAITKQIQNADMVLLNKKDLLYREQLAQIKATIMSINTQTQIYVLSMKEDSEIFTTMVETLESDFKYGESLISTIPDVGSSKNSRDPEIISNTQECKTVDNEDNDLYHFNVNSYADSYELSGTIGKDEAMEFIIDIMDNIKTNILGINPRFLGHLKMFLHTGTITMKASVTSYHDKTHVELIGPSTKSAGKFTVFAAVTDVARDSLAGIIEDVVTSRSCSLGITISK